MLPQKCLNARQTTVPNQRKSRLKSSSHDGGSSCRIVREEGEIVSIDFEMLWVDKNAGISVWMNCHLLSVCSVNLNTRHREPMQAHHSSRPLSTTALFWAKGISSQNKRKNDKLWKQYYLVIHVLIIFLMKCLYNTWTCLLQHWFHEFMT